MERYPPPPVGRTRGTTKAALRGALPIAEEIGDRTISLPLYPALGEDELDRVVAAVARAFQDLGLT